MTRNVSLRVYTFLSPPFFKDDLVAMGVAAAEVGDLAELKRLASLNPAALKVRAFSRG